jgi:hypothetical protein
MAVIVPAVTPKRAASALDAVSLAAISLHLTAITAA